MTTIAMFSRPLVAELDGAIEVVLLGASKGPTDDSAAVLAVNEEGQVGWVSMFKVRIRDLHQLPHIGLVTGRLLDDADPR